MKVGRGFRLVCELMRFIGCKDLFECSVEKGFNGTEEGSYSYGKRPLKRLSRN